ncbi:DUF2752 domain-containing protein [Nocardioides sp.]|uniref:DUF2752 domain-containing protein n=1 Tax=Nocardioides sp. TaxID=35761 RepID=UPI002720D143|nr:DUF2752 domain-containing protein [Nocardioides sp.]MDO9458217.1 DUF2752 domain-containing protein [Nocardioides sp.]
MVARSPDDTLRPPVAGSELVAAGGLVAFGTAFLVPAGSVDDGPVLCPFRRITGLPCPACGLTRSWVDLAHGDVAGSWAMNPFGIVLVGGLLVLVGLVLRARRRATPAPVVERLVRRPVVALVGAAWLVFGVLRMAG